MSSRISAQRTPVVLTVPSAVRFRWREVLLTMPHAAEWWTDRMQAWVHYVPIQLDYSDLYDAIAFVSRPPRPPSRFSLTRFADSPADHCM
jgi:hypothetical protein